MRRLSLPQIRASMSAQPVTQQVDSEHQDEQRNPGVMITHGLKNMYSLASAIISPQLGSGGGTPQAEK